MSLTKSILQPTGFTVEYWRVSTIVITPIEQEVYINLNGYKDKAAFDAGASPAMAYSKQMSKEEFVALTTPDVVPTAKAWIQIADTIATETIPELAGAVEDPNDVI